MIVRFVRFEDAKRVLSGYSTFVLHSSHYYRQLGYEKPDTVIGDINENIVKFEEGKRSRELLAATLLSCWTKLEGDHVSPSDWNILDDRADGIAVVSTAATVRDLLRDLLKGILYVVDDNSEGDATKHDTRDRWFFRDGEVRYYDGVRQPPEFDTMDAWLWKLKSYERQREFRFAFLSGSPAAKLQSVIFHVRDPGSYIEKIYFGPRLCGAQKSELFAGAIEAQVQNRIENFEQ